MSEEYNSSKTINRVIDNKIFEGLDVEIIVPFHDKHSLLTNLLEDIFATVHSNRYLVTLVDDGSRNSSFSDQMQKKKIPGVRLLRKKHGGFGSAINYALSKPWVFQDKPNKKIPYVVLIHSDVSLVNKNWLLNLGVALETLKRDGVKMVSPMTDNPGVDIEKLKSSKPLKEDETLILEEDEYLPLYCALCNRGLFDYVKIVEKPYVSDEAVILAEDMKSMGFKQAVCKNSWVKHKGRGTISVYDRNHKVLKMLRKAQENHHP